MSGMDARQIGLIAVCIAAGMLMGCRSPASLVSGRASTASTSLDGRDAGLSELESAGRKPGSVAVRPVRSASPDRIHKVAAESEDDQSTSGQVPGGDAPRPKGGNLLTRWFTPQARAQKPQRMPLPLSEAGDAGPRSDSIVDF